MRRTYRQQKRKEEKEKPHLRIGQEMHAGHGSGAAKSVPIKNSQWIHQEWPKRAPSYPDAVLTIYYSL